MVRSHPPMVIRCLTAVVLRTAPLLILAVGLATTAPVQAHALLDEGHRLYEEAEFVAALDALGRATAGDDLTHADLEELLELRALIHSALGDEAALREDLRLLAAVAPDHALHRGIPPDVQRIFTEIRASSSGSPRLIVTPAASGGGVTITVSVENDWASVVRRVRIRGRMGEAGPFSEAIDAPLFVGTPLGEVVSYYAEAVGPGGAVIASSGTESEPLQAAGPAGGGGGLDPWPFVIGGAAAVVVGVVIAVVVVATSGGGQPTTVVEPFTVRF